MRARLAMLAAVLVVGSLGGCARQGQAPSGTATGTSASAILGAPESAATSLAPASAQPQAQPAPTGPVNVLSLQQGTILRSWPAPGDSSWGLGQGNGWSSGGNSIGPYVFVFELPSVATIAQLVFSAGGDPATNAHTVHVATSLAGSASGFNDVGTYQLNDSGNEQDISLSPPIKARWFKLTIDSRGGMTQLYAFEAMGSFDPRPPSAPVQGAWKVYDIDNAFPNIGLAKEDGGSFPGQPAVSLLTRTDKIMEVRQNGSDIAAAMCGPHTGTQVLRGSETATTLAVRDEEDIMSPATINAEETLIVAGDTTGADGRGRNAWMAQRLFGSTTCTSFDADDNTTIGSGSPVLVLYDMGPGDYPPFENGGIGQNPLPQDYPGFRFVPVPATFFDPTTLGGYSIVALSHVCQATSMLTKQQAEALVDFVYEGHKLIVDDADECTSSDYSFLPYAFTTSNPGKNAAKSSDFVLVESNTLGSNQPADSAHFVDMKAYVNDPEQQLGDANVVTTQDRHWCGHIYGTNVLNANGYAQMFAPFGQGMIIYDGFDADDASLAELKKINLLELEQAPNASLPCSQLVAAPFSLADLSTGSDTAFTPGSPKSVSAPLALVASHGANGSASLKVQTPSNAGWPASLSQNQAPFTGGITRFHLNVSVPSNAKPGRYPFVVSATDSSGNTASTTVTVASAGAPAAPSQSRVAPVPATPKIAKTLATAKRVAVYGIYFDFGSAQLKPKSAPVLKEIADALKANPSWKLTIEGHTDNIGTSSYNLDLSRRRATSVKAALVSRYHIGAARLSTVGYGFSRPKAPNDTPQGRALNRRVELVRS